MALSSGEAEFYSVVKAAAEGLGVQALACDLGWELGVRVLTDSSAAKSICSRRGVGKLRHVEVRFFWIQEAVRRGRIQMGWIRGTSNPADVLTKCKTQAEMAQALKLVGAHFLETCRDGNGQAAAAT